MSSQVPESITVKLGTIHLYILHTLRKPEAEKNSQGSWAYHPKTFRYENRKYLAIVLIWGCTPNSPPRVSATIYLSFLRVLSGTEEHYHIDMILHILRNTWAISVKRSMIHWPHVISETITSKETVTTALFMSFSAINLCLVFSLAIILTSGDHGHLSFKGPQVSPQKWRFCASSEQGDSHIFYIRSNWNTGTFTSLKLISQRWATPIF